ncbi:RNA polymerase sigma factor [Anaerobutyricum hallii]|uniref:RNA polymerase sigma factor n=1 Tax=Anaerobutyricum hallii TaxID=39488 RepID=A0A415G282_9FIRM|nr:RNA polymerase sigma factor [Anaerobutyricum hallii]
MERTFNAPRLKAQIWLMKFTGFVCCLLNELNSKKYCNLFGFICYMYERSRKVSRKGSENLDKHLLEALYHRYYKELYIFVYSLCGSETVTDDILQDTFLKALLALKDSHTNMRAWLYMVARNLYYNSINEQVRDFA